jgi:hypothetical protein
MLSDLVPASEAVRLSAGAAASGIIPAMCGCLQCGTRRMIAGPVLGICEACGADIQILIQESSSRSAA